MKKLIIAMIASAAALAQVPAETQLGCQLYTGESAVFEDLTKFNISKANSNGERTLNAFSAECTEVVGDIDDPINGLKFPTGNCIDTINGIECSYQNCNGKDIKVFLDYQTIGANEIEGEVTSKGFFRTKSNDVSCNLLTF